MNKIDQIKTALSDPACESVTAQVKVKPNLDEIFEWVIHKASMEDQLYEFDAFYQLESFQVNHTEFPEISIGDTISTRFGVAEVENVDGEAYWKYIARTDDGELNYFHREEIVLLSKAK